MNIKKIMGIIAVLLVFVLLINISKNTNILQDSINTPNTKIGNSLNYVMFDIIDKNQIDTTKKAQIIQSKELEQKIEQNTNYVVNDYLWIETNDYVPENIGGTITLSSIGRKTFKCDGTINNPDCFEINSCAISEKPCYKYDSGKTIIYVNHFSGAFNTMTWTTNDDWNTGTHTNTTTNNNNLLLTPWWNSNWLYSTPLNLTNNNDPENLQGNYTISTEFNLTNCANAGKCLRNASDVRIVWDNGTAETEIDRIIESSSALDFDGTNDYVDAITDSSLDITNEITVIAWVHPIGTIGSGGYAIVSEYGNHYTQIRKNSGSGSKIAFWHAAATIWFESNTDVPLNQWSFITVTFNKSETTQNVKFYLNGVANGTGDTTTALVPTANNLWFGNVETVSRYFNGTIDEVAIFNRTLNSTEISDLYNNGIGRPISSDWFNTTGLIGLWHMDEKFGKGITDSSGNNNDGELGAGTVANMPKWTQGKITEESDYAQGYDFDGTGDYISINPYNSTTPRQSGIFSLNAWVKTAGVGDTGYRQIYDDYVGGGTQGLLVIMYQGKLYARFIGSSDITVSDGDTFNDGNWHFISVVYNDTHILRYIDGTPTGSIGDITGATVTSTNKAYIGINNDAVNYPWNGVIDDVSIFNRSLNATEISNLYNNGNGLAITSDNFNTTGLVGYWKLDGNTLDSSDNSNDGTPYGDAQATFGKILKTRNNTIRFKVQENISTSTTDQNYSIYYGNINAGNPPIDVSDIFLDTGLVAYWSLDGHVMDIASGNDGVLVNEPQTVSGFKSDALQFDGTDDYVNLNDVLDMDLSDFTIVTLIKKHSSVSIGAIISKYGDNDNNKGYYLGIGSGGKIYSVIRDATTYVVSTNDGGTTIDNKWHHIVVTFDRDGNMVRYLDGTATGTADAISSVSGSINNLNDLRIAARHDSSPSYFNGTIDEVRIYNRSLSATEINQLYISTAPSTTKNTEISKITTGSHTSNTTTTTYVITRVKSIWNSTDSWKYKKEINISNTGGALTDYQVNLTILKETDMNTDYSDLRFTDTNGNTIPFWIEQYNANNATVWIKTNISASTNTTILMYYGNAEAENKSNGDNTFIVFDDFLETSVDTEKWTILDVTTDVSNSILTLSGFTGATHRYTASLLGKIVITEPNVSVETKAKTVYSGDSMWIGMANNDDMLSGDNQLIGMYANGAYYRYSRNDGIATEDTTGSYSIDTYYRMQVIWNNASSAKFYIDGIEKGTQHTTNIANENLYLAYVGDSDSTMPPTIKTYWIFARKYTSTPPTISST
ncbi:DUF2341 domain-containing protein, partial [archaeon]|nr:DUF2341 domain-containing protein [archaeon]